MNPECHLQNPELPPAPDDPTPHSELPPGSGSPIPHSSFAILHSDHRRHGKVARLTKPLRDQVNQMLLDGVRYDDIITHLGPHGAGLTPNCLSTWRAGGHQDWLKEQSLLEQCRLRQELTFDFATGDQDINCFQAAHNITAALLCEALAEFGSDTLRQAFQANPLTLLRAVNSLARITAGGLRCQRHLAEQSRAGQSPHSPASAKKGLTAGTFEELKEQLSLM